MYITPLIIAETSAWLPQAGHWCRFVKSPVVHNPSNFELAKFDGNRYEVSNADLEHLDKRLIPLLKELHMRRCFFPLVENAVYGKYVRYTFDHWNEPHLNVTDRKGKTHAVRHFKSVLLKSPTSRYARLEAEVLDIENMKTRELPINTEMVLSSHLSTFWLDVDQLESLFPGWKTRMELCEALEVTGVERVQQIFSKPGTHSEVSLPSVDFNSNC